MKRVQVERRRFESMYYNILLLFSIGIWYTHQNIILPVHLRVSILKYCVVNAALFLDNPVRTVRPVLVTRPNPVPTIILLFYYTVCLFYTARPTYIVARRYADIAAVYHESSQDFDASKNLSLETAA